MAKSFSIKIGADTKEFNKELRAADRQIRTTTRLGDALTKTLEHKYDAKTAAQAQKQFQKALNDTHEKAEALRRQLEYMEKAGKVDTNQYRKLETDLAKATLEAAQLEEKLEKVKNLDIKRLADGFKEVGTAIEGAGKKLAPFSAAAGGVIAAAGAIAKKASDLGDDIDEMSERFDISSDTIQRWSYLSIQSGVETNTFSRALIRMRAAMADIAAGASNKATDVLQSLGISPDKFKNSEEMFDGIIQALRQVEDSTLQTAYANEIFGDKIANDMLPYIRIADETLAQYNAEFDAMPTLTAEQVKALDHLSDSYTRFTTSMQYAAAQMGAALAPIMERVLVLVEEKLVPAIQKLADWFGDLSPAMQNTILATLGVIAVLAPLLILIGKISTGIGALINTLPLLGAKLTALSANPIIAILGVIAALVTILYLKNEQFRESINQLVGTLTTALAPVLDVVTGLVQTLFEILSPVFDVLSMLITIAIVPLTAQLNLLAIPLKLIGTLLKPLLAMFEALGSVVETVFDKITGGIEAVLNWLIDKINIAIRAINKVGGVFGFEMNEIPKSDLNAPAATGSAGTSSSPYTNAELQDVYNDIGYTYPRQSVGSTSTSNSYTTNTSNDTFNIYIEANEYVNAEEVADIVSKRIATLARARG